MNPQTELKYLECFKNPTKEQADKKQMLEEFISTREKYILLDADSLLYNVVHFHRDKDTIEDLEHQYEDFLSQKRAIVNKIEEDGFNSSELVYYFTMCKNNFRYNIYPEYKKKDKPDEEMRALVSVLKYYVIQMLETEGNQVKYSDTLEADDLISIDARQLESIIVSLDKDLKQISGAHFDYYKQKTGEQDAEGFDLREFRGWSYTTPQEGYDMFLKQMLIGDTADNIKGAKGVGKVGAAKLVTGSNFEKLLKVARKYDSIERMRLNVQLMRL